MEAVGALGVGVYERKCGCDVTALFPPEKVHERLSENQTSWGENSGHHGTCPWRSGFAGTKVGDREVLLFLGGRLDSRKNLSLAAGLTWEWALLPLP